MKRNNINRPGASGPSRLRRGTVILLASGSMVMVFGFAAFSVDVGYIALTKTQLQAANDAAVLAAGQELVGGLGHNPPKTSSEAAADARQAAIDVAAANRAGDQHSIYVDGARDVRLGQYVWNGTGYDKNWGIAPYNLVEVTLHRDQAVGAPDGPLPLFFAPVIGHRTASLRETATSAMIPGNGVRVRQGSNERVDVLPFALDEETWLNRANAVLEPGEQDLFGHDFENDVVTSGGDGVLEINLYPASDTTLPPGNRGTVDIGANNNSTADLARQILEGLDEYDLSFFENGELKPSEGNPLSLQGDTGISAGMKEELAAIKGQPRLIPIFREVPQGNGNNCVYEIIKFVPVTIVDVKLTGNPKRVMIQPCPYWSSNVVPGTDMTITEDSYFTPVVLVP